MIQLLVIVLSLYSFAYAQEKQSGEDNRSKTESEKRFEEHRKQSEKSVEEARRQVALNPNSAEAHFNLAESLFKWPSTGDDYDKITNEYLRAIQLKPDYAEAHYRLGVFYVSKDKHQKGYEALNNAIQLKPDYADAYCALGFAYIDKKFGDGHRLPRTDEESTMAIIAFKKAIQIKPDLLLAYVGLGEATYHVKKYDEALEAFKNGALLKPDDPISHMGIGAVYIELGNEDAAMLEYETLKRIASQFQEALKEQGRDNSPNPAQSYAVNLLKQIQERFRNR